MRAGVGGFRRGLRSGQAEAWATPLFCGGEFTQAHGRMETGVGGELFRVVSGAGLGRAGVGVGVCMGGVSQSSQGTCRRQGWEPEGLWVWEHF